MPTTIYNSQEYLTSSIAIIREFISENIENIDVIDFDPGLSEEMDILKPILMLQVLPGFNSMIGLGNSIGSSIKGEWVNIDLLAYWILKSDCGDQNTVKQLAQKLQYLFKTKRGELKLLGIDKAQCGGITEYLKGNNVLFGGRMLISYRCLVTW